MSKLWLQKCSDRDIWRDKIRNSFEVSEAFLEEMKKRTSYINIEYICYHRLSRLFKNIKKLTRTNYLEHPVVQSALDPTGFESELLVDCLLDDIVLLKRKIPSEDFVKWFTISCFAGCYKIPLAIADVSPIDHHDLYTVALSGNLRVMQHIVNHKEKFDLMPTQDTDTLNGAIESGNTKMVTYLLDPNNGFNLFMVKESNPLDKAAKSGNFDMFKLIHSMHKISNIGLVRLLELTSGLLDTASKQGTDELIDYLLDIFATNLNLNPSINQVNCAAQSGNSIVLKQLIEKYGVKPTVETLSRAAASGNLELLIYLLDPKFSLVPDEWTFIQSGSKGTECFDYLINNFSLKPDPKSLKLACMTGNLAIVKKLLSEPYNLKPTPDDLDWAAKSGVLSLVKFLVETKNMTPSEATLTSACLSLNPNVVKYILQKNNKLTPKPYRGSRHFYDSWVALSLNCQFLLPYYLDTVYKLLVTEEKEEASDDLEQAAEKDRKLFYLMIDHLLISMLDEELKIAIIRLEVVQSSPLPMTQLYLGLAGRNKQIALTDDKIINFLKNAYKGFQLLGRDAEASKAKSERENHKLSQDLRSFFCNHSPQLT